MGGREEMGGYCTGQGDRTGHVPPIVTSFLIDCHWGKSEGICVWVTVNINMCASLHGRVSEVWCLQIKMSILLILLTITPIVSPFPLVRRTLYNETEARIFLQLAAGAYAEKPDECLNRYGNMYTVSIVEHSIVTMLGWLPKGLRIWNVTLSRVYVHLMSSIHIREKRSSSFSVGQKQKNNWSSKDGNHCNPAMTFMEWEW